MSEPPTTDRTSGWLALFGVIATLALVFAFSAVVLANGDEDGAAAGAGSTGPVHVSLSEFAVEPATITVPQGGSLHVQNDGSTTHNLEIVDQDLRTADLPAGGSEELDVSSLEVGTYEVLCRIPGHADSGMTGTLEVTAAGGGAEVAATDTSMAGMDHGSGEMTEADYQRMSDAMDATISEFPAETEGVGNEELEPTVLADGTKHFEITAAITDWEVAPGQVVQAWTYNGMVPGPQMRVDVGDHVEIELHNELPAATDMHLHGVNVPNSMDGVAPVTQNRVEPGETFTYEFTADEVSVAMYHAHHMAQMTVPNGLLGMFYVGRVPLPAGQTIGGQAVPADVRVSQEIPMVLNDAGVIGYSLNGKSFPATAPIVGQQGDWIEIHYANEGTQIHPMHLHQFDQIVIAEDGYPLDHPYTVDTLNVAPGQRFTVLVQLEEPGTWVWHCHILPHVERESGMYGMVTAVVVE
jgi:FtsP/CotA-like multicopper oxidase with cupredoxin domain